MQHIRKLVPKYTLHDALILPYFNYFSVVLDNCSDFLPDKVQKMQNRAASIVSGSLYDVRCNDVLKELNWQSLW